MDIKKTIIKLAELHGPSGSEDDVAQYAAELLRKYTDNVQIKNGSVIAEIGTDTSLPKAVLDAHTDSIGFAVTSVENGFAKVANLGGIDLRQTAAQRVTICGRRYVKGVICTMPPHLKSGDGKVPEISDIYIDISGTPDDVSPGDTVIFDRSPRMLTGNMLTGGALDDRCGMAAILYALENTDISSLKYRTAVVFSSQEEIGSRGAQTAAFDVDADIAIAVDVSFAYSQGEDRTKCGELGKGCMVGFSPCLDKALSTSFCDIAEERGIRYQKEIMNGKTGTNADKYTVSRGGARGVTLSVPLKYMHTPGELIDIRDVISTGELIAAFLSKEGE